MRSEGKIGCSKPEKGARRPARRAGEEAGRGERGGGGSEGRAARLTEEGKPGGASVAAEGPARGGGRQAGVCRAAARDVAPGRALSAAGPRRGTRGDSGRRRPGRDGSSRLPRVGPKGFWPPPPPAPRPAAGRHEPTRDRSPSALLLRLGGPAAVTALVAGLGAMKPSPAGTAKELEPPAPARGEQRTAEPEGRWREKGEADTERQRTRERQEATLAGLAELEYLRQRQELLVRGALRGAGSAGAAAPRAGELLGEAAQRSRLEEKFLEENILLLRKQLVGHAQRWSTAVPAPGLEVGQVTWGGREVNSGWGDARCYGTPPGRPRPPHTSLISFLSACGAWAADAHAFQACARFVSGDLARIAGRGWPLFPAPLPSGFLESPSSDLRSP